jgi:hypothetical protein
VPWCHLSSLNLTNNFTFHKQALGLYYYILPQWCFVLISQICIIIWLVSQNILINFFIRMLGFAYHIYFDASKFCCHINSEMHSNTSLLYWRKHVIPIWSNLWELLHKMYHWWLFQNTTTKWVASLDSTWQIHVSTFNHLRKIILQIAGSLHINFVEYFALSEQYYFVTGTIGIPHKNKHRNNTRNSYWIYLSRITLLLSLTRSVFPC